MDDEDHKDLEAVKQFNPYDLYSKSDGTSHSLALRFELSRIADSLRSLLICSFLPDPPKVEELKPYYQGLIKKFFPDVVEW